MIVYDDIYNQYKHTKILNFWRHYRATIGTEAFSSESKRVKMASKFIVTDLRRVNVAEFSGSNIATANRIFSKFRNSDCVEVVVTLTLGFEIRAISNSIELKQSRMRISDHIQKIRVFESHITFTVITRVYGG